MNNVQWSDAWSLDFEPMDSDHRIFVSLLARAQAADDRGLAVRWQALMDHTRNHFARENGWMRQSRFANTDNHALQHRVVLHVMQEGMAAAQAGQVSAVRAIANELAAWFIKHTQSLDAALALHLRRHPEWAAPG